MTFHRHRRSVRGMRLHLLIAILALTLLSACRVVIPGVGVWECQYQNVNGWLTPVCDLVG